MQLFRRGIVARLASLPLKASILFLSPKMFASYSQRIYENVPFSLRCGVKLKSFSSFRKRVVLLGGVNFYVPDTV